MNLFKKLFGGAPGDEPADKQRGDVTGSPIYDLLGSSGFKEGVEQVEGAYGPFGYSATNPVPVNGAVGETVYLNRLRSRSGVGFMYHRVGSTSSPVSDQPVDHYELVAIDGSEWHDLFFAMYFLRRSTMAPEGLSLVPWGSIEGSAQLMCKLDCFGTRSLVPDFPMGLARAVEGSPELRAISPGLGAAVARRVADTLNKRPGGWARP